MLYIYLKPYLHVSAFHIIRDGFAVKLRKFKLQGPSLAQAPLNVVGGAVVMCSLGHMFLKNFPK